MKKFVFKFSTDSDTGIDGWRLEGPKSFEPTNGRGVAHDILEHKPNDKGTFEEELEALGSFAFVRIESGFIYEKYFGRDTPEQILARDIGSLLADAFRFKGPHSLKPCSRKRALSYSEWDDSFKIAIEKAKAVFIEELDSDYESREIDSFWSTENEKVILNRLRQGFSRAQRRYRCPYAASDLFRQISSQIDSKYPEGEEGDILEVFVNISAVRTKVKHTPVFEQDYTY